MTHRPIALAALAAAAAALATVSGAARAAPVVSVVTAASPVLGIDAVTSSSLASALAQSTVTAIFSDGSRQTAGFTVTTTNGPGGGNVQATATDSGFLLVVANDLGVGEEPLFSLLNLHTTLTLSALRIDGRGSGSGRAAFDQAIGTVGQGVGTPGSERGITFSPVTAYPNSIVGTLLATYLDPLALAGASAVGDLFGSLQVDFDLESPFVDITGLPPVTQFNRSFSSFEFRADIDTVSYTAVSPPPKDPPADPPAGPPTDPSAGTVPEPASASLLGLAALLAWAARRRPVPA